MRSMAHSRRAVLSAAAVGLAGSGDPAAAAPPAELLKAAAKGNVRHSACLWCYRMPIVEFAPAARALGLVGADLVQPADFPVLKEHGLICTMTHGVWGGIQRGLNRREHHAPIRDSLLELIDATADAGFSNVICFSGNRGGQDDGEGIKVCAEGVKQVLARAEARRVTLCMELLNSRVDHADYQCDRTEWGVDLCKAIASERFKLLYDIYHMQIMEGDVIRTVRKHHSCFGHYHTGGNPGRGEIDDTQELHYPAIVRAILATGYQGVIAQEFIPKRSDKLASLAQAVGICDV